MPGIQLVLEVLLFSMVLWSGLYLLSRNWRNIQFFLFGAGTIVYTLSTASHILSHHTITLTPFLTIARFTFIIMSGLSLLGGGIRLFIYPAELRAYPLQDPYIRPIKPFLLPALVLSISGLCVLLMPFNGTIQNGITSIISVSLLLLNLALAFFDARVQGERLQPDLFRSFDYSFGTVLLFGGQIGLLILLSGSVTFPLVLLLLTTISTSIFVQTFLSPIVKLLDIIAFAAFPKLRQARVELQTAETVITRVDPTFDIINSDEAEFTRLTRRAISNLGDLSRLATSPLTQLPHVELRLKQRGARDDALERARELKQILVEGIDRLKPNQPDQFGTTPEWRYYNALYFPYIIGLKPYGRRNGHADLNPTAEKALEWFRVHVPERTLYNWQQAASKLIAQELRGDHTMKK